MPETAPKDVLTTREAARLLGLSVTSVQRLVMDQVLEAWVTPGGHRRISLEAVERYRDGGSTSVPQNTPLKVLLVDDDARQCDYLKACLEQARWPLSLNWASDTTQALIQIERHRPDLIITDLAIQPFDGLQLIGSLAAEPEYSDMAVLVITDQPMDSPSLQERLPDWACVYPRSALSQRLIGYVDALCCRKRRSLGTGA